MMTMGYGYIDMLKMGLMCYEKSSSQGGLMSSTSRVECTSSQFVLKSSIIHTMFGFSTLPTPWVTSTHTLEILTPKISSLHIMPIFLHRLSMCLLVNCQVGQIDNGNQLVLHR